MLATRRIPAVSFLLSNEDFSKRFSRTFAVSFAPQSSDSKPDLESTSSTTYVDFVYHGNSPITLRPDINLCHRIVRAAECGRANS